jgi:hypothetical protein
VSAVRSGIIPCMEQIPLDLEGSSDDRLEALSIPDLESLYKEKVGISSRGWDKETLISAINNPGQERIRVGEIDNAEDKDDLSAPYRG